MKKIILISLILLIPLFSYAEGVPMTPDQIEDFEEWRQKPENWLNASYEDWLADYKKRQKEKELEKEKQEREHQEWLKHQKELQEQREKYYQEHPELTKEKERKPEEKTEPEKKADKITEAVIGKKASSFLDSSFFNNPHFYRNLAFIFIPIFILAFIIGRKGRRRIMLIRQGYLQPKEQRQLERKRKRDKPKITED